MVISEQDSKPILTLMHSLNESILRPFTQQNEGQRDRTCKWEKNGQMVNRCVVGERVESSYQSRFSSLAQVTERTNQEPANDERS